VLIIDFVLAIRQGALKRGRDIYDDCVERILAMAPALVGFSAQCTTYPAVIRISKKIKGRDPHVKIVIGGMKPPSWTTNPISLGWGQSGSLW